jgi:quinol monooxygenase YgiN
MIIIAGYTLTEAHKRDAAVEAFANMVEQARKYDGCLDFSMSADSVAPDRVNLFECWRDQQSLDAWRKVANPPKMKIKRRETYVKLYRSDKAEEPF